MFLEYGKGSGETSAAAPQAKPGFELTPTMMQTFGQPCRQSSLHPRVRKSVEEFQSTPGYLAWREKFKNKGGK